MNLRGWLQRLALNDSGVDVLGEAVRRQRVSDFIVDYRRVCEEIGPWQYAADLGLPSWQSTTSYIAYLAAWRDGPRLRVWEDVVALDAIDLVIDAAREGFEAHLVAHPADAEA